MGVVALFRVSIALVLAGALLALAPLAYASVPDPVWIGGVYDDGDHDDVVVTVIALGGWLESTPLLERVLGLVRRLHPSAESAIPPGGSLRVVQIRAPPTA